LLLPSRIPTGGTSNITPHFNLPDAIISSSLSALAPTIAKINIARIELSQNNFSNALEALESFNSNNEHPLVYEVKGDALIGLDKSSLALDQYALALKNTQNESEQSILKMKINKLNN
jgi:predicted negative regulator of RcsB-dependent stress response